MWEGSKTMHVIGELFHGIGVLVGDLLELALFALGAFVFFAGLQYLLFHR